MTLASPRHLVKKFERIGSFDSTLVENMERVSSMDRYYRWLADGLRRFAGRRILDMGCGSGNLTAHFLDRDVVVGIDRSAESIGEIRRRFEGQSNFRAFVVDICQSGAAKELVGFSFDTIITMNAFEHIEDDGAAFRNAWQLLEPRGKLLIVVPAMPFLYSIFDYNGGHYRRYSRRMLAAGMEAAGFRVLKVRYINLAGALGWYVNYVLLKRTIHSRRALSVYDRLVPFFRAIEMLLPPPFGLSVIGIAEKVSGTSARGSLSRDDPNP